MDRIKDKDRVAALSRALRAAKSIRQDNVPCQIEDALFLGSIGAANNMRALKSFNVTHILTLATSLPPAYPNDFIYKVIFVSDREDVNILEYFEECCSFIDEAKAMGGGVLIHCFAGRSRSVAIVVAYLLRKGGKSLSEVLDYVKTKRPVAAPNSGFVLQLQNLEKSLLTRNQYGDVK